MHKQLDIAAEENTILVALTKTIGWPIAPAFEKSDLSVNEPLNLTDCEKM